MGLVPEAFERMTPAEFIYAWLGWAKREGDRQRQAWERERWAVWVTTCIQLDRKDRRPMTEMFPLPWEKSAAPIENNPSYPDARCRLLSAPKYAIRAARDARYFRLDTYDAVPAGVGTAGRNAPPDRRGVLSAGRISGTERRTTSESDRHAPRRSSSAEDSGGKLFSTAGQTHYLYRSIDAERPHDLDRQHIA